MKMLRKGQIGNLQGFILGIVGVAVVLAVGLIVLTELQSAADNSATYCGAGYTANASESVSSSSYCLNTSVAGGPVALTRTQAYTSTGTIITKLATVPTWVGIIIVVALAFIVLGFFYMRGQ